MLIHTQQRAPGAPPSLRKTLRASLIQGGVWLIVVGALIALCGPARAAANAPAGPTRIAAAAASAAGGEIVAAREGASSDAAMPNSMAYLRQVDPSIAQDIRYASAHNFTGRPIDGYGAAECVLQRDVALALSRVQAALRANGYSLKMFDCYRPTRAVADFERFAEGPGDPTKGEFYPRIDKRDFEKLGYVAHESSHSRATTVDLTLSGPGALPQQTEAAATRQVDCAAPYGARYRDGALDMGTGFDCFDSRANTANAAISEAAKKNRKILVDAMAREGFVNYSGEWWHFSWTGAASKTAYNFPIAAAQTH